MTPNQLMLKRYTFPIDYQPQPLVLGIYRLNQMKMLMPHHQVKNIDCPVFRLTHYLCQLLTLVLMPMQILKPLHPGMNTKMTMLLRLSFRHQ